MTYEEIMKLYPLNYIPPTETAHTEYEKGKVAGANWSRSEFIKNVHNKAVLETLFIENLIKDHKQREKFEYLK